ncbi:MAG: transposase [Bryobacteraceae bacterium]
MDGAKALHAAVRRHAGEAAFVRRCQVHDKRKVLDHLPEEPKPAGMRGLHVACAMMDYEEAKRALERLRPKLLDLHPSAARSLEEGVEGIVTAQKYACVIPRLHGAVPSSPQGPDQPVLGVTNLSHHGWAGDGG